MVFAAVTIAATKNCGIKPNPNPGPNPTLLLMLTLTIPWRKNWIIILTLTCCYQRYYRWCNFARITSFWTTENWSTLHISKITRKYSLHICVKFQMKFLCLFPHITRSRLDIWREEAGKHYLRQCSKHRWSPVQRDLQQVRSNCKHRHWNRKKVMFHNLYLIWSAFKLRMKIASNF